MYNHKLMIKNLMEKYSFSNKDKEYLNHIYQKKAPLMMIENFALKDIIKTVLKERYEKLERSDRYIKEYKHNIECLGLTKQAEHRKLLGQTSKEDSAKVSLAIRLNLENLAEEQENKAQIKEEIRELERYIKILENRAEKVYC